MKFQEKKYYLFLTTLVVVDLAMIFWLASSSRVIKSIGNILADTARTRELAAKQKTDEGSVKAELEEIKQNLDKIDFFVEESNRLDLIKSLEDIAAKHNLKQTLKISTERKDSLGNTLLPLEIILIGRYPDQLGYLIDLERLKYQINVSQLNATNAIGDQEGLAGVKMTLESDAYLGTAPNI